MRPTILIPPLLALTTLAAGQSIMTHGLPTQGTSMIDKNGNAYVTGFGPVTPGAAQTQPGGGTCYINAFPVGPVPQPCPDAYAAKIDPDGQIIWGTLLGGPKGDLSTAIATDSAGNVYIAGTTEGSFPTTSNAAIAASNNGGLFAAKISADGSQILYATYLPDLGAKATFPGLVGAKATAIAVDPSGNAIVVGQTKDLHAYAVKISADGSAFLYSRTLSGSNLDDATTVVADPAGNAIIGGYTKSPDFPIASAIQQQLSGDQDAFLTRLGPDGNILSSTYLGGSDFDTIASIQLDSSKNIYVAGETQSIDFPTTRGVFQFTPRVPLWGSGPGGFVAKLSPEASTILYSTYVPSNPRGVAAISIAPSGIAYIAGRTGAGFPVTNSAPQACSSGWDDAFIARLDAHGALLDATYLGGPYDDGVSSLTAVDQSAMIVWSHPGGFSLARVTFGDASSTHPACLTPTVLNSASLLPGGGEYPGQIGTGEFVSLTGFGIGPEQGATYQLDDQGRAPTELAGVRVLFDGIPAPIFYAQSRQVNTQVPFEITGNKFTTLTLEYNGTIIGSITSPLGSRSPAIFRLQPDVSAQALAVNENGTFNSASNPAAPGSVVSFWGNGYGAIAASCPTGTVNPGSVVYLQNGFARFGGPGHIGIPAEYTGSAPTYLCGIVQINFRIPLETPSGPLAVAFQLDFAAPTSPTGRATDSSNVLSTIAVK